MSDAGNRSGERAEPGLLAEISEVWRQLPDRRLFLVLFAGWLGFFHWVGNAERGYINTSSLFGWVNWVYSQNSDDAHGRLIPFVVLALLWWKRQELLAIPKAPWWPALGLVVFGLMLHVLGFMVQQSRISLVGFVLGLYGITGMVWGWRWLARTFFPVLLFAFCVPLASALQGITFPMRLMVTKITTLLMGKILALNIIQDGTRIYDAQGNFRYDVEAACAGLRSLTATLALTTIFGFMNFKSPVRRLVMIASAFPLAVMGNVVRLSLIILVADAFGQKWGNYVHDSSWLSLLPYVPAIAGIGVLGHLLREDRSPPKPPSPPPADRNPEIARQTA